MILQEEYITNIYDNVLILLYTVHYYIYYIPYSTVHCFLYYSTILQCIS